jgi:preprotein translocase subunit SecA
MAVADDIMECHKRGQPVLVGTTSIEKNEIIGDLLTHKGIPHQLLNAKNHLKEALIIAEAGKKGAVTVATNMAGRGVDIILGGSKPEEVLFSDKKAYQKAVDIWKAQHEEVKAIGGLHVIGTDRHESRRIDNQLRGRSGRQGDPGSTRFYVSLEDDIMRLFGGDQVAKLMTVFKLPEDVPLEHPMVSRSIEQAQTKVEGFHFDSRKHLVEYDDVLNKHREIVYSLRRHALMEEHQKEKILANITSEIQTMVTVNSEGDTISHEKIIQEFATIIPFDEQSIGRLVAQIQPLFTVEEIVNVLQKISVDMYEAREKQVSPEIMRQVERWVSLSVIDNVWMDHLEAIDDLREGIGLRGYGQRDPLVEYKNEAFSMFERLMATIESEIAHRIFKVQVQLPQGVGETRLPASQVVEQETKLTKEAKRARMNEQSVAQSTVNKKKEMGRNDPCWCGSGKKWKKCHYPKTS